MRSRTFNVPVDLMIEFAEVIVDNNLNATIEGYNNDDEDDELIDVCINYDTNQKRVLHELQDLIDEHYDE